jgi:hypothetical protein
MRYNNMVMKALLHVMHGRRIDRTVHSVPLLSDGWSWYQMSWAWRARRVPFAIVVVVPFLFSLETQSNQKVVPLTSETVIALSAELVFEDFTTESVLTFIQAEEPALESLHQNPSLHSGGLSAVSLCQQPPAIAR